MKANELRIGNYIQKNGEVSVLASINCDHTIRVFNDDKSDTWGCFALRIFEPVPLTEEWHNKFGVIKNGFNSFDYILKNKFNLYITISFSGDYVLINQGKNKIDDCVSIWNKDLTKRDMYVHEFQNLYFILAGEELETK